MPLQIYSVPQRRVSSHLEMCVQKGHIDVFQMMHISSAIQTNLAHTGASEYLLGDLISKNGGSRCARKISGNFWAESGAHMREGQGYVKFDAADVCLLESRTCGQEWMLEWYYHWRHKPVHILFWPQGRTVPATNTNSVMKQHWPL